MKLFFYCQKINFLRVYSTIINEALNRNHLIEIYIDQNNIENSVDIEDIKEKLAKKYLNNKNLVLRTFKTNQQLINHLEFDTDIDFYILIYPMKFLSDKKIINKVSNKVVFIMSGMETVGTYMHWNLLYKNNSLDFHTYKKYLFTWTTNFLNGQINAVNTYGNKLERENIKYLDKVTLEKIPVGFNEIDSHIKNYDKNLIRQEFNIGINKEILVYLPYPISLNKPHKSWQSAYSGIFLNFEKEDRNFLINFIISLIKKVVVIFFALSRPTSLFWVLKGYNEKNMIKSIRKFCDKNKILFVIKRRNKHRLIDEAYKSADLIIEDNNNVYPTNYQKLLRISKLVLGYHSAAVFEAVKMDVPYLNIESPIGHFQSILVKNMFSAKKDNLFNFSGIVWNHKIKYLLNNLQNMCIGDFKIESEKQNKYIEKYLNKDNNSLDILFNKLQEIKNEYSQ
tara:strand:+ start:77 stop:1429 length:1353 start_codon:yes stop_codon:yes gene_type:complete